MQRKITIVNGILNCKIVIGIHGKNKCARV